MIKYERDGSLIDADVVRSKWGAPPHPCPSPVHHDQVMTEVGCVMCAACFKAGAVAFWDLIEGRITYPAFMRRLRRHSPPRTSSK